MHAGVEGISDMVAANVTVSHLFRQGLTAVSLV